MIKELLGQEKEIWVELTRFNRAAFLRQAKTENFCWFNGKEIDETDDSFLTVAVCADHTLAKVPCFMRTDKRFENVKRVRYVK